MCTAIVVLEGIDPGPYLWWAVQFARVEGNHLLVLSVAKRGSRQGAVALDCESADREDPICTAVRDAVEHEARCREQLDDATCEGQVPPVSERITFAVKHLAGGQIKELVLTAIRTHKVELLILPRERGIKSDSPEYELRRQLFRDAPSAVMQLVASEATAELARRILVPSRTGKNTSNALHTAAELAEVNCGQLTALLVLKDFDAATQVAGERIVRKLVGRYTGDERVEVRPRATVASSVAEGVRREMQKGYDLVLLGATYHSRVHRMLFSSVTEQLLTTPNGPPLAVLRPAIPLGSLAMRMFENFVGESVPQLDRPDRLKLVEKVHASSQWDFDFVALICLSTIIATLGLLQNSTAVVIGAMLVAPLMTPLLGAGLSLVQGNRVLGNSAASTVGRGFLLALVIAVVIGWIAGPELPTREMLARGSPGIFDLVVAFVSGVAAAYASGRPNLLSALPGVAIAAALVPPISTAGLAMADGDWQLAAGALLLFFTNIVAIVLGAACSLWGVGIRGAHEHGFLASWAQRALIALLLIALGLGIYEWGVSGGP